MAWGLGAVGRVCASGEECLITDTLEPLMRNAEQKSSSWVWFILIQIRHFFIAYPQGGTVPTTTSVCHAIYLNLCVFQCSS